MNNKQHVFLKTASKILTYDQNLEFRFTSEYNLIKDDHISNISYTPASVIKQCEWTLEMSIYHPILKVGLFLNIFS